MTRARVLVAGEKPTSREIVGGRKAKSAFVRIAPTSKYDDTKRTFFKRGDKWRKRVTPSGRVVWEPVE